MNTANPSHAPEHLRRLRSRNQERAATVLSIRCDGCEAEIQATRTQAKAFGWRTLWKRVHAGLQVQQDRCPSCPRTKRLVRFALDG